MTIETRFELGQAVMMHYVQLHNMETFDEVMGHTIQKTVECHFLLKGVVTEISIRVVGENRQWNKVGANVFYFVKWDSVPKELQWYIRPNVMWPEKRLEVE